MSATRTGDGFTEQEMSDRSEVQFADSANVERHKAFLLAHSGEEPLIALSDARAAATERWGVDPAVALKTRSVARKALIQLGLG